MLRDFGLRYASHVGVAGSRIRSPCLVVPGQDASVPRDGCIRTRWLRQLKFECGCCEMLFFRVCCVRQNLYVLRLYSNFDLDNRIFYCLLASMAAVQAEDVHASFLFVGVSKAHHQEWLGPTTTNRHGVAAFDVATAPGCDQLDVGPTHARGGRLNLMMTDVPDLVRVAVVSPIGNSDHSCLSAVISKAQAVPNLCVSRKVFLKQQVNWNTVCGAIRDLPWRNIGFLTILLRY